MRRRITVPDNHVALVLPVQLADELMTLLLTVRQRNWLAAQRVLAFQTQSLGHNLPQPSETDCDKAAASKIAGDVMLALLEAREA